MANDSTLRQGARLRQGLVRGRSYLVRVVAGPDQGIKTTLDAGMLIVGTHDATDLQLHDKDVSRYHLQLRRMPTGIEITDLGSTYGTFHIDGEARTKIGSITVPTTDREPKRLLLGSTTILEIEAREQSREAPDLSFGDALGSAPYMLELFALLARVAATDATVLFEGESGTGKELLAEEVHRHSPRGPRPFVVVDCAAMSASLIGSELFGHARGAFSGADRTKPGLIEQAEGGTVLLDEIGELPLALQPNLLRVLEKREVQRLGDAHPRPVDVRFIATTGIGLGQHVREGRFREDLFFRLAVVRVAVPPLRKHLQDIPMLIREFARRCDRRGFELSSDVLAQLMAYEWPGNVRELRNLVERALSLGSDGADLAVGAPAGARTADEAAAPDVELIGGTFKDAKARLLEAFEREYLTRLLARHRGNVTLASVEAGIDRNHIHRLVKKYGLVIERG